MILLDGKKLSLQIQTEISQEVQILKKERGIVPHLAALLVGSDPASKVYVKNKVAACERVGFESTLIQRDESVNKDDILQIIEDLNSHSDIDGYIVQLPLPSHLDSQEILLAIDPAKDVDGFHPMNIGRMVLGMPAYIPATPYGILTILERYGVPTEGKKCVVLGRSNIVGTPMAILLSRKSLWGNATVTMVHSRTKDIASELYQADIVVAAIGIPNFVSADMIRPGAVVIDVGINRIEAPDSKRGFRLVGDVDFDSVGPLASHMTPVPGGVGPMTVTSLLLNTLKAAKGEIYGIKK